MVTAKRKIIIDKSIFNDNDDEDNFVDYMNEYGHMLMSQHKGTSRGSSGLNEIKENVVSPTTRIMDANTVKRDRLDIDRMQSVGSIGSTKTNILSKGQGVNHILKEFDPWNVDESMQTINVPSVS